MKMIICLLLCAASYLAHGQTPANQPAILPVIPNPDSAIVNPQVDPFAPDQKNSPYRKSRPASVDSMLTPKN